MWILGISRHHNGAICLLQDGEIKFYLEEDRLSRLKYDGFCNHVFQEIKKFTNKLDWVGVAGYDPLDINFEHLGFNVYFLMLRKLGLVEHPNQVVDLTSEHHLCHAACGFYNSGFEEAATLIIDGAGSIYGLTGDFIGRETTSIYHASYPDKFDLHFKNIVTPDDSKHLSGKIKNTAPGCEINITRILDIGKAYQSVAAHSGFDIYDCGKTMGLASYGVDDPKIPPTYTMYEGEMQVNMMLFNHVRKLNTPRFPYLDTTDFQVHANLSKNIQDATQQKYLERALMALEKTGSKNLVVSGGYALNCTANYFLKQNLPSDVNLYVEPISHDGGTSIGCAKLLYYQVTHRKDIHPLTTLALGPKPIYNYNLLENETESVVTDSDIVELLLNQNIVAVFQGLSEAGPRALGNRSLIFDPRNPDGKNIVNKIKQREGFRPFAASVLEEHAENWFDLAGLGSSPYMMYAVNVNKEKAQEIPAVVHVDGTCRIQTVKNTQTNWYSLIEEFYKKTSVPMVFNTSFNLAGDPLVETMEHALETLRKSELEYLYLPELKKLIYVSNKYKQRTYR